MTQEKINQAQAEHEEANRPEQEQAGPTAAEAAAEQLEAEHAAVSDDLPDDPEELKKLLREKTSEAADNYNRALRLQADYENLRRRSRQEKEDLLKFGAEHLIKNLLPVLDNFERALASAGDGGEKFISGVQMIHRQLYEVLTAEGLAPIPAQGEPFDPNLHEAVMQVTDADQPENTVVEELRKGYYLKGKVIRPAMVKVAVS
ncbi:nucleotide exchange factor GrpE [Desulforamulus hydrothermalis]|uniref:Protein GrpE n=1 Tax=Desulforamulus hydrothermalis Lam5 = DSM 18033 TaxID=1121428 RepID=K8EGZ5_9FIRM|nr:nucleotide exchange factor GrpE [Desulforamulus hydrothermalis]CCO07886.1 Protein grpE [Desulforamulus hydrothermalis Lam5 = DSM 18033]SHH35332.1 molecular chaperone GrpE [Desulforamulus hydrothermalis Lam5 = DSM 18033]